MKQELAGQRVPIRVPRVRSIEGGEIPLRSVLALFTVGDVYASLYKRVTYAPFSAQRRLRALFWL